MLRESILKEFDNFYGYDCKLEDNYLLIEQEIDKETSVNQEIIDYSFLITNCENYLCSNTKDIKLITLWFYSKCKLEGFSGFIYSFDTYIKFLEKYFEQSFPNSKKSKINLLLWLETNLTNLVSKNDIFKKSIQSKQEINDLFKKLSELFVTLTQKDERYFRNLLEITKETIIDIVNKTEKIVVQKSEKEITDVKSDFEANKLLKDVKTKIKILSKYYRNKNFINITALRITRFLSWLEVDGLPLSEGSKTSIYPPQKDELLAIEELYSKKNFQEASILIEEIIEVSPFWITGHYYIYNILIENKSYEYAEEIKNNLLSFIKTNQELLNLNFIDGSPFCNNESKIWIENELNSKEIILEKEETKEEDFLVLVNEYASRGKIKEAMKFFEKKVFASSNEEEKFNLIIEYVKFAIKFDKKEIALVLLEELEIKINIFNLTQWNPRLSAKVYHLILSNFTNIDFEPLKFENMYKVFCKLDIEKALEIKL
ncbi:MAG: TssA family type VI secretion system protein [Arcobacter sp.]|uniref:TssA family type VI secretion system protein n=1 Tax=Arcobacter sp. TaxID=1872629 RepID=UPI003D090C6A